MNVLIVLFFKDWSSVKHCFAYNKSLYDYVRQVRVSPESPVADHYALVIGRHNGAAVSTSLSKEQYHAVVPHVFGFPACGSVILTGHDFNDVACHKPAASEHPEILADRELYTNAALDHLRLLPPIYTGDMAPSLKRTMAKL